MTIKLDWYDESQTTIHAYFEGHWSWDEVFLAEPDIHSLLDHIDHPFSVMIEFEDRNWLPQGVVANIPNMLGMFTQHKHLSVVVILGAGPMINAVFNMVLMVARHKIPSIELKFSETIGEAHSLVTTLLHENSS